MRSLSAHVRKIEWLELEKQAVLPALRLCQLSQVKGILFKQYSRQNSLAESRYEFDIQKKFNSVQVEHRNKHCILCV